MKTTKYLGLVSSLLLASVAPGRAQELTLDKVLAGREMPLSMMAKQLTGDYKRMVVNDQSGISAIQSMMISAQTGVDSGLYYTKGETVTAGSETYLIAYRPQFQVDLAFLTGHGHANNDQVQPRKLRPNMTLCLSLLNLRTNSQINDIRAFDPKQDMESPQESSEASVRNLRALGQGMMTYLRGRGQGKMPTIGATVTPGVRRTFYPFVHDQNLWVQPATEEPYRPSTRISGVNVNRITNRQFLPAFYENTPGSDGLRGVLFLDGHVERVTAQRWARLQTVMPRSVRTTASAYPRGSVIVLPNDGRTTIVTRNTTVVTRAGRATPSD